MNITKSVELIKNEINSLTVTLKGYKSQHGVNKDYFAERLEDLISAYQMAVGALISMQILFEVHDEN